MTYNPISVPPVDFTWEREWRILTAELSINPADCSIIMPNADWADALIMKHRDSQEWEIQEYKTIFQDETIVELFRNDFQWTIYLLDDRD